MLATLPFLFAGGRQSGHCTELTAIAFDLLYRRLSRMPHGILPPATPPEQPGEMPRQNLTLARILPRLHRARRNRPVAGLTHAT